MIGSQLLCPVHIGQPGQCDPDAAHGDMYRLFHLRQFIQRGMSGLSRRGGSQHHLVPILNPGVNVCFLPVDSDHSRFPLFPPDHTALAVYAVLHRLPPAGKQIFVGKSRSNGGFHHGQSAIVVKFYPLVIKTHKDKVIALFIITQTDTNGRHHQRVPAGILHIKTDGLHHFLAPDGHSLFGYPKLFRQGLGIAGNHAAASHHKHGAHRLIPVQFPDAVSHFPGHPADVLPQQLLGFIGGDALGQSQNIRILYRFLHPDFPLDLLCRLKLHQAVLHQYIRQTVSGDGNHAVCGDGSLSGDGDIAGSRSHIYQGQIQHAEFLRDGYLDGRNGLQSQIRHLQTRRPHRFVQAIHHIVRQKCGDQVHSRRPGLMSFQITHGITVEIVAHGGIAHTVELHVRIIVPGKLLVSLFHPHGFQRIDILAGNLLFHAVGIFHGCSHRPQHPARGGDAHLGQFPPQILLQQVFHLVDSGSHLADIVNLPVQHGAGLMLLLPLGHNVKPGAVPVPHRTHDAPGADIQSKYQFPSLYCRHVYPSSLLRICR